MTRKNIALLAAACAIALTAATAEAGSLKTLYAFKGGKDGDEPTSSVTPDGLGNFYGTTTQGGNKRGCNSAGCGTVFRLAADGTKTTIYAFKGGKDGASPHAVTFGPDGALYGTTAAGGGSSNCNTTGCGTVYRLTTDGQEQILHAFEGFEDGARPAGSVTFDKKGNLFGTTLEGGFGDGEGFGAVFEISSKGKETILHAFDSSELSAPEANVVIDSAGNLYGTAPEGGSWGVGGIFKITPDGSESVLHSFEDGSDGATPYSDLMIGKDGNLYGTTYDGGDWGEGAVFRVTPAGVNTVLYSFIGPFGDAIDGAHPRAGVIADKKGNLYGTAMAEGEANGGVVYKLAPDGTETLLHDFTGGKDGRFPRATLATDGLGNVYGTTAEGGFLKRFCEGVGCGTVFRVNE